MAKLFISFTGTLYALKSGRVTVEDLNEGLFLFGCTRRHAFAPGSQGGHIESIVTERPDLHALLMAAVERAEAAGRVSWRPLTERNANFGLVDELLTGNGYKPLLTHEEAYGENSCVGTEYCYPAVEKRSTELEVIWRG